jgi:uncharacterized protein DUF1488
MFQFPDEAAWNEAEDAVEFPVRLGEYEGRVFVARRVFHDMIGARPTPERCIECFHMNRTAFERIAEAKLRGRELSADANIRIDGRDVRRLR